jgi:methionine-S-sulfoxide reductase
MKHIFLTLLAVMVLSMPVHAQDQNYETALLAGGCFWCIEADFEKLDGVIEAVSGYSGGDMPNPTYQNYNKPSGGFKIPHIEVIEVTYDPQKLTYKQILEYHVRHIDPTDGDGQFCDRGPGYIPAIFVENDQERQTAINVMQDTANEIDQDVKVRILDAKTFYPAEDYHQNYAEKNSFRYKVYRWNCGRDARIAEVWGR